MTPAIGDRRATEPPWGGIEIRHVRTHEEFVACVDLQMATWGAGFRELVPATMLKISQRLGGVTAGAFTADGTLVGFVFGITGVERGGIVHWSDMLAVRGGLQGYGLGRRLKEFQRDAVRAVGADRIYWTFDPLVARNAHFNINRLDAHVSEYVPDMYGHDTGSAMHSGFGTDRFIVVWPTDAAAHPDEADTPEGEEPAGRPHGSPGDDGTPVLNPAGDDEGDVHLGGPERSRPPVVRIEIPPDIFRVQGASVADAVRWRRGTRQAFQRAFATGYAVERFEADAGGARAFYRLRRT